MMKLGGVPSNFDVTFVGFILFSGLGYTGLKMAVPKGKVSLFLFETGVGSPALGFRLTGKARVTSLRWIDSTSTLSIYWMPILYAFVLFLFLSYFHRYICQVVRSEGDIRR